MSAPPPKRPLRLKFLPPADVRRALDADPRLIVPVGTCEQHGGHLPLGSDTLLVERLADDLSAEFGILVAPTIEYGVNATTPRPLAGNASVRRKTLRRWVNDLLLDWEREGVQEFLLLTAHGHAPHQEALGTVVTEHARVRVIDVLALEFGELVDHGDGPIHGGEVDTSLALYVAPHLVRMEEARDFILPETAVRRYRRGSTLRLPALTDGSVGQPTRASAEKGRRVFEFIKERIRTRVLGVAASAPEA
jgi:creatinine amidohydrolase